MTKSQSVIKSELLALRAERMEIDRKIRALELYFEDSPAKQDSSSSNVRSAPDIRPTIREIFHDNGNSPLRVGQIMSEVEKRIPGIPHDIVKRKMYHVKQSFLEKVPTEYGAYRMP